MARIVGIHGIANTFASSANLTREWFDALQGGLEEASGPRLNEADLTVTAYGALFRPDAQGKARVPSRGGTRTQTVEPTEDWERQLIEDWWRTAAELSTETRRSGDPSQSGISLPTSCQLSEMGARGEAQQEGGVRWEEEA